MADQLSGDEFLEIREAFNALDPDNNGVICLSELRAAMSKKRSNEEISFIMRLMDNNNSGTIEFQEYMKMVAVLEYKKPPYEYHIKQMFKALDQNGDGLISLEEIKSLWNTLLDQVDIPSLNELSEEDAMNTLDANQDKKVDYEEFVEQACFHLKKLHQQS